MEIADILLGLVSSGVISLCVYKLHKINSENKKDMPLVAKDTETDQGSDKEDDMNFNFDFIPEKKKEEIPWLEEAWLKVPGYKKIDSDEESHDSEFESVPGVPGLEVWVPSKKFINQREQEQEIL